MGTEQPRPRQKHPKQRTCEVCGALFEPPATKRATKKTCSADCHSVLRSRNAKAQGLRKGRAKLSPAQVEAIRQRRALGEGCRALAREFGVHHSRVSAIIRGGHQAPAPTPAPEQREEPMDERTGPKLRTRIIGHGEEDPTQLLAHPQNFRRHPGEQLDALRGSMKELGWLKGVIVNRTTGHVIDGHARVEESMRQGLASIPVDYVELSEAEEKLALAVLDPISEMAYRDDEALNALLAEVVTEDPGLQAMLDEMRGDQSDPEGKEEGEIPEKFQVVIECSGEEQQRKLLERFISEGLECRALNS